MSTKKAYFMPDDYKPPAELTDEWSRLVSVTNWMKGAILQRYVDEAPYHGYRIRPFIDVVGGMTETHARSLLHVQRRFGEIRHEYPDLLWFHFNSAVDWDDAIRWLDLAETKGWSAGEMRLQRWAATE